MALSATDITELLWDFREDRRAIFSSLVTSEDEKRVAIQGVIEFLKSWEGQDWIDVDRIAILGREISRCCNANFITELNSAINNQEGIDRSGAAFFSMQVRPDQVDVQSTLPASSEFSKVAMQIESANEDSSLADFESIVEKYVAYFLRTGAYQPVGFSLNRLFRIGQQNSSIHYLRFHTILDGAVRRVFSMDATDEYMWLTWAGSYLKLGAVRTAESILWEAFRRRPDSASGSNLTFGAHV